MDGVLGLISSRPRSDRDTLKSAGFFSRGRRALPPDKSPLRDWYRSERDADLYSLIVFVFGVVRRELWGTGRVNMLNRAVGIRGLLRTFGRVARAELGSGDGPPTSMRQRWEAVVAASKDVDFGDTNYFSANDVGTKRIDWVLSIRGKLMTLDEVREKERAGLASKLGVAV